MGFVDRGGGREAKGSSLRRSKKNPGAPSTKNRSSAKHYITPATRATPTPPASLLPLLRHMVAEAVVAITAPDHANPSSEATSSAGDQAQQKPQQLIHSVRQLFSESYPLAKDGENVMEVLNLGVDTAVAILSRKLEVDGEGIFRRAAEEGHLSAMLCWCNELERQPLLMETCRNHNKLALKQEQSGTDAADSTEGQKRKVRFAVDAEGASDDGSDEEAKAKKDAKRQNSAVVASLTGGGLLSTKPPDVALYCLVGVHVNNIDRTSRKVQEQWIDEIGRQAKGPEVLGILSGLNLGRESGTHYAQEWMLKECWRTAAELRLPLVLHIYTPTKKKEEAAGEAAADATAGDTAEEDVMVRTATRAVEVLQELLHSSSTLSAMPVAVVLYNGLKVLAASPAMRELVRAHRPPASVRSLLADVRSAGDDEGQVQRQPSDAATAPVPFYVMVTAEGLCSVTPGTRKNAHAHQSPTAQVSAAETAETAGTASAEDNGAEDLTPYLPLLSGECEEGGVALSQLLVGTGAPWGTPQNIPDEHLRTLPNEPGNFGFVVKAVHDAMIARGDGVSTFVPADVLKQGDVSSIALRNFVWAFFSDYLREQVKRALHGSGSNVDGEELENDAREEVAVRDGEENGGRRPVSSKLRSSGTPAAHVDVAAVPTAFVCIKCRAPLFYPSALVSHKRGSGANATAAAAGKKGTGKKGKGSGKKNKGRRGNDSEEEEEDDLRGGAVSAETCASTSALFLQVTVDDPSSFTDNLLAAHGSVDMDRLISHIVGIQGEQHAGSVAIRGSGGGKGHRGANDTAVVACTECQAKLGDLQFDGACYDCGAVLNGVTVRLRPRAVEECPIIATGGGGGGTAAAKSSEREDKRKRYGGVEDAKSGSDEEDGESEPNEAPSAELTELDLILAAAAREREQLEKERLEAEEAGASNKDEDSRRKKEKKKNVKANNRSNFTHFRNKDFAPRLAKEKKLNHQRRLEGFANSDSDSEHDSDDEQGVRGEESAQTTSSGINQIKPQRQQLEKGKENVGSANESGSDSDGGSETGAAATTLETMTTAATRRQRKKASKKRQQQQQYREGHSGESSGTDGD